MTREEREDAINCFKNKLENEVYGSKYNRLAIEALEQEPRWISVSERLPAFNETVIVTNGRGTYIGWINPTDKPRGWRVDSVINDFMDDVIAWMPLP